MELHHPPASGRQSQRLMWRMSLVDSNPSGVLVVRIGLHSPNRIAYARDHNLFGMKRRIALPAPLSNDTIQRLRAAIMAGLPNGRCLMSLRRFEASIDRLAAALDAAVRADEPAALDDGLASVLGAQRQKLQVPDGVGAGPRYQQLMAAWQGKTMPDEQRPIFERHLATDAVQGRLRATHPELAQALQPFAP